MNAILVISQNTNTESASGILILRRKLMYQGKLLEGLSTTAQEATWTVLRLEWMKCSSKSLDILRILQDYY